MEERYKDVSRMDIRGRAEPIFVEVCKTEQTLREQVSAYESMQKWMIFIKQGGTAGVYLLSRQSSCGQEFFCFPAHADIIIRAKSPRKDVKIWQTKYPTRFI